MHGQAFFEEGAGDDGRSTPRSRPFYPKRPHTKSRRGCVNCKTRKVSRFDFSRSRPNLRTRTDTLDRSSAMKVFPPVAYATCGETLASTPRQCLRRGPSRPGNSSSSIAGPVHLRHRRILHQPLPHPKRTDPYREEFLQTPS